MKYFFATTLLYFLVSGARSQEVILLQKNVKVYVGDGVTLAIRGGVKRD